MTGGGQRLDDSKTGGGEDSNNCRGLTTNDWKIPTAIPQKFCATVIH